MANRLGRLVDVVTSDGVMLHGFASEPRRDCDTVWVFVHGVNSNFYSSSLISELCDGLAARGFATLAVNTRGHDIVTFNTGHVPRKLGSQHESIDQCLKDLDAWTSFANREGFPRLIVVGHSLGAVKGAYWLAHAPRKQAIAFVSLSPPRLNTSLLANDAERGALFQQHLADAQQHCDAHHPDHVMKVRFPIPMWISASTYLDKYGCESKYDYATFLPQLATPTLWMFGENEVERGSSNFRHAQLTLGESISQLPNALQKLHQVAIVRQGDHSYHGVRDQVVQRIGAWYAATFSSDFDAGMS